MLKYLLVISLSTVLATFRPCPIDEGKYYIRLTGKKFSYYASDYGHNEARIGLKLLSKRFIFQLNHTIEDRENYFYGSQFTLQNLVKSGKFNQFQNAIVRVGHRISFLQPINHLELTKRTEYTAEFITYCDQADPTTYRLRVAPSRDAEGPQPESYVGDRFGYMSFTGSLYAGAASINAALVELIPVLDKDLPDYVIN